LGKRKKDEEDKIKSSKDEINQNNQNGKRKKDTEPIKTSEKSDIDKN